jgi:hypothetical protein
MIKRVTIYGDSFAEPQWANSHPTWYGRLRDRWPDTVNYGKSGAGPMYSFKQFYQDLPKLNYEDLIVFVMSGAPRIYFNIKEAPSDDIHQWNNNICRKIVDKTHRPSDHFQSESEFDKWASLNIDKARFALDTFRDETIYGNWKYESLLYTASRIQKCKIFIWCLSLNQNEMSNGKESYIKTSLNDDYFYVHDESLEEACSNEYVEAAQEKVDNETAKEKEWKGVERNREGMKWERERYDLNYRINHFTEMNHEVMYKQVTGFVDGREIPKFLKNVYKGTYNKDEFIYD